MRISPPSPVGQRRQLSSLGRHLQRSVLATCFRTEALRKLVPAAGGGPAVLIDAACAIAAAAGPRAEALDAALNTRHGDAIRQLADASDYDGLRAYWIESAGSPAMPGAYWALVTHPLADRTLRHLAFGDVEMLRAAGGSDVRISTLLERRSVAPRRLGMPAPTSRQIDLMVQAALAAPDHGRLRPWRIIEFGLDSREALSALFEREKGRRDPLASAADLGKAREHALQPPCLLAFVVGIRQRKGVPEREQLLAAGAALGNLMNAAQALGFGAIVLSGDRCFDPLVAAEFGLLEGEFVAGFVSIGSVLETPPEVTRPLQPDAWSRWQPAPQPAARSTQELP
ncbi:nitroreductase family protein [Variovorax saccharolyticus]|uniref:nitroreductase family protein n=1 Tax=Variovorax saccharolyticus TaxID=3053516 RepID=UPI00257728F6|nr:nitroreductase [Variovorax sp. J31P216]MDM0025267.1 nitroreductase [Variovorax sp. J31P216]